VRGTVVLNEKAEWKNGELGQWSVGGTCRQSELSKGNLQYSGTLSYTVQGRRLQNIVLVATSKPTTHWLKPKFVSTVLPSPPEKILVVSVKKFITM
jgi:hypothetical protein